MIYNFINNSAKKKKLIKIMQLKNTMHERTQGKSYNLES